MGMFGKLKFVARLMADPDIDRIYRELKEASRRPFHQESMDWWRRQAAFLFAHSLEQAVKNGMTVGRDPTVEPGVIFMGHDKIRIGDRFVCSFGATVRTIEAPVTIGDQVSVGPFAAIIGANHGLDPGLPIQDQPHVHQEVTIGDDVWIGAGALILPGAMIGSGAVVGAGAVVTGPVAESTVVAGSPARPVGKRGGG